VTAFDDVALLVNDAREERRLDDRRRATRRVETMFDRPVISVQPRLQTGDRDVGDLHDPFDPGALRRFDPVGLERHLIVGGRRHQEHAVHAVAGLIEGGGIAQVGEDHVDDRRPRVLARARATGEAQVDALSAVERADHLSAELTGCAEHEHLHGQRVSRIPSYPCACPLPVPESDPS
jgi:hypothetical protein